MRKNMKKELRKRGTISERKRGKIKGERKKLQINAKGANKENRGVRGANICTIKATGRENFHV